MSTFARLCHQFGVSLAVLVVGVMAVYMALSPTAVAGSQLPVGPEAGDREMSPFYRWSSSIPGVPGTLLKKEPLPIQDTMDAAGKALRLLHTSTDVRWRSGQVPVSGTLFLPKGRPPEGGWPLLAWGHGTLGIADVCAPSWTGFRARDAMYMNRWLNAGFAVVATDYQGLGGPGPHPYLYWQAEGRSILDSARAALAVREGLVSNQVLLAGQSQGAGAALGAAILSDSYAPDIHVLGVVSTGINSTFPAGPVSLPVRNSPNMFLSFASGGLKDDGARIEEIISDKGRQVLDMARRACTGEVGKLAHELGIRELAQVLTVSLEELQGMRIPVTDMPMASMNTPILIGTGLADATIVPMRQFAAVSALCAAGNKVTWHRYEGLGHDGAMHGSFDASLAFARALLAGGDVGSNCPEIAPPGPPGELKDGIPFNDD